VGCARCHDHKYDPIPTRDYYALAGVFLNTRYHEYPLAPQAVVDEYKAAEKKIEKKQELLDEFLGRESQQLAGTLVFQAAKYMQAAWKVTGEPKTPKQRVVDSERLDYELFDRWLRFLAKPQTDYKNLTAWQDMIKAGGTAAQARTLAEKFQEELVDVMLAKRAVTGRRDAGQARRRRRKRHHSRQGAARHQEEGTRQPAARVRHQRRLSSSPTTTSVPAAGWN